MCKIESWKEREKMETTNHGWKTDKVCYNADFYKSKKRRSNI